MSVTGDIGLILLAVVLVLVGGLFAAVDSALNMVSRARVEEMVKDGRPGAQRLLAVVSDRCWPPRCWTCSAAAGRW